MGKAIRVSCIGTRLEKVLNWDCVFVNLEKGLFLSLYVDDIKTGWDETNETKH